MRKCPIFIKVAPPRYPHCGSSGLKVCSGLVFCLTTKPKGQHLPSWGGSDWLRNTQTGWEESRWELFSGRTVHAKFHSSDSSRCKSAPSPNTDLSLPMENEGLLSSTRSTERCLWKQYKSNYAIISAFWWFPELLIFKKLPHNLYCTIEFWHSFYANWADRVSHRLFRMYMFVSFYATNISIQQILSLFVLSMCS